jgi:hypothetical protein
VHVQLGFIIANQVQKMPCGIQWLMNHHPSRINKLGFHLFWDATKNG